MSKDEDSKKGKKKRVLSREIATDFYMNYCQIGGEDDKKDRMVFWNGDFYQWEGECYRKLSKEEIGVKVTTFIAKHADPNPALLSSVILNLKEFMFLLDSRVLNTWLTEKDPKKVTKGTDALIMKNGIFTIDYEDGFKVTRLPHTPQFFSTVALPYDYDPNATCELWEKFIAEAVSGDPERVRILKQWAGYLLTSGNDRQCFMLLLGEAGTGKSTYMTMMRRMLGEINCSSVPVRRFSDRFTLKESFGKKLNTAGDAEEELTPKTEAIIKEWVGQDPMTFEEKFGNTILTEATAKLMISCNLFPTFQDKSNGSWRRLKVVIFDRADTGNMDWRLLNKLTGELPGIFVWALAGLKDLYENGGFSHSEVCDKEVSSLKFESNPLGMFFSEEMYVKPESESGVRCASAYATYVRWAEAGGFRPLSSANFGKQLRKFFPDVERVKVQEKGIRAWRYVGLYFQR